jgi:hypothetical protein
LYCCLEASQGGRNTHADAGYSLAMHLGSLGPFDIEEEEWHRLLDELSDSIDRANETGDSSDDDVVIAWFERWVPRCMALVPRRRWPMFLKGVYRYAVEEGNGVGA